MRYLDEGYPGQDNSKRPINTEFVLNQPRYQGASILISRANFGCGSSREHAPWALKDYGFDVVIAPSFADIFFNNCFKNGILPIVLADELVDKLFKDVDAKEGYALTVDLQTQQIVTPANELIPFEVDEFRRHCLLNGLDDIGLTLVHGQAIKDYEAKRRQQAPWLFA